jgi:two-component system, OmpR family, response regulator CpxR
MSHTIFVIDDDEDIAESISKIAESIGLRVKQFTDPVLALEEAMDDPPDAMIIDQVMPAMMGTDFIQKIRENNIYPPIILCTGVANPQTKKTAALLNVIFIEKPLDSRALVAMLQSMLEDSP